MVVDVVLGVASDVHVLYCQYYNSFLGWTHREVINTAKGHCEPMLATCTLRLGPTASAEKF